jgi:hypothetical protein
MLKLNERTKPLWFLAGATCSGLIVAFAETESVSTYGTWMFVVLAVSYAYQLVFKKGEN